MGLWFYQFKKITRLKQFPFLQTDREDESDQTPCNSNIIQISICYIALAGRFYLLSQGVAIEPDYSGPLAR